MTETRKTLLIMMPGFPADENDSNCLPFPQTFVRKLKETNPLLNIVVFAFQYPFSKLPYNWHGAKVFPFGGREKGKLLRLFLWWKVYRKAKEITENNNVAGILSFWLGECALLGKFVSRRRKLKWFVWLMGQDAKPNNRYFSLVRPKPESLIALSDFLSDEFYRNYAIRPAHVVPPGIDAQEFPKRNADRKIDLIGVGSLIALKQYDVFISVVAELVKKYPQLRAVICGKGPERDNLIDRIWQLGLQANIDLLDEVRHDEVLSLMQRSKILLHPSRYEGFATVYPEALFAGAHVVGFCRPMNALIHHLHVVGNVQEMIGVTERILTNEQVDHSPVLTCPIEDVCETVLSLFVCSASNC
jgi:glycosyltransferase involved in cell wall biosynthesis